MNVVSVNAGRAELMKIGARTVSTGIWKPPVERAHAGRLGLSGDVVADQEHHGGADQALYLYSADDYAFWAAELGRPLAPGTFGENVTLTSFGPDPVRIGDRFRAGAVLVEVTAPRIPCSVFAERIGEPEWVKRFAAARRPGLYTRVLEAGALAAGDPVERLGGGERHPEVVALMDAWYDGDPDPALLERLLEAPLAERARAAMERKLARLADLAAGPGRTGD